MPTTRKTRLVEPPSERLRLSARMIQGSAEAPWQFAAAFSAWSVVTLLEPLGRPSVGRPAGISTATEPQLTRCYS